MKLHAMVAVLCLTVGGDAHGGVRPIAGADARRDSDVAGVFDPADSAALFVGVREFTYDKTLTEVRYAVDDAIDLAFVLAIDRKPRLVEPQRVILALSGDPQKPRSQRNLEALIAAGAVVQPAGHSDVLTLLERQSQVVGPDGILIVAFATHGISVDGAQYLLTASSLLKHRETTVSEMKVREIASRSDAGRSLILLDACRQRLTSDTRDGEPDPLSAAALLRAMAGISGQVVFSAAAADEYAYDDDVRRNGVFTAAFIDGLRCGAPTDADGFVTVDTLSAFVEERVLWWIRRNRNPGAKRATQLHCEGRSKLMPLTACPIRTSKVQ